MSVKIEHILENIDGYQRIKQESASLKKYGHDYGLDKGRTQQTVERIHPRKLFLKVSEIQKPTSDVVTVRLVCERGTLPPFLAGQYLNVEVTIEGINTARPYSISSPPHNHAYVDITIKRVPGGVVSSHLIDQLQVGDHLETSGPAGQFYYNPVIHGKKLVFLAGGSGITPVMSMIREFCDRGLELDLYLLYGSASPNEIIFEDELNHYASYHSNLSVTHVISSPAPGYTGHRGFLSAELIGKVVPDAASAVYYLCGPAVMMTYCMQQLEVLGIPKKHIRKENFNAYTDITQALGWPDNISATDHFAIQVGDEITIDAQAGESLLTALERGGVTVPSLCRSGECSLCRVKVDSGQVFEAPGTKTRKSDCHYGYVHSCSCYPITNIRLGQT